MFSFVHVGLVLATSRDPYRHHQTRAAMPQEATRSKDGARQLYVDGDRWLVYELPPMQFDRRSTPSLVFESEHVMRRVRNFPAEWRTLRDEDLFTLSTRA
jgi:hypothetical protein